MGVIVRLERESFQVLNNDGKTVHVKHQSISKKKDSRHAVALDSDNNNLQVKDVVKVIDGAHAVSDSLYVLLVDKRYCISKNKCETNKCEKAC